MSSKKSILFISSYEIVYNPRLIKAADYFENKGWEIHILTPIVGVTDKETYSKFVNSRKWNIIEIDISNKNLSWLYSSVLHLILKRIKNITGLRSLNKRLLNKALYNISENKIPHSDVVYVNLVNNLMYANALKNKWKNTKLVYDSQEYFTGQYSNDKTYLKYAVSQIEEDYIHQADYVCATTSIMADVIQKKYNLKNVIKLRNLPFNYQKEKSILHSKQPLNVVWHGLSINYMTRGVNIIIDAISKTKNPIHLTLQGNINNIQNELISTKMKELNIAEKISIVPPANPDNIVESLIRHDVGIIGEMPLEENQKYTSSNKLFDYIQAGLSVISSDMPGLNETLDEFNIGKIYKAGDSNQLAIILDQLYDNPVILNTYKKNAQIASKELIWEKDFNILYSLIGNA